MVRLSRRIGVEIEVVGMSPNSMHRALSRGTKPSLSATVREGYGQADRTDCWKATPDGSVSAEAVSPPLGATDSFEEAYRLLREAGATVDRRCGAHVHVDCMNRDGEELGLEGLKNVMRAWRTFAPALYRLVARSRATNTYSHDWSGARQNQLSHSVHLRALRTIDEANTPDDLVYSVSNGKYTGLNLTSYVRHNTVEFRLHQGTLDAAKMRQWTRLLTAFVDAAQEGRALPGFPTDSITALLIWCKPTDLRATSRGVIEADTEGYAVRKNHRAAHRGGINARHVANTLAASWMEESGVAAEEVRGPAAGQLVERIVGAIRGHGLSLPADATAARKRVRQLLSHWRKERREEALAASRESASDIEPFTTEDWSWFLRRSEALGHTLSEAEPTEFPAELMRQDDTVGHATDAELLEALGASASRDAENLARGEAAAVPATNQIPRRSMSDAIGTTR